MSVEKYSLKFIILSRYAPSLVSNPRDEMIRFVIGVADLVKEDFRTAMLHNDMNFSRLLGMFNPLKSPNLVVSKGI